MSRVGKLPISIPDGTKINILSDKIEVEGPKGKLSSPIYQDIKAEVKENQLILTRKIPTSSGRHMDCAGVWLLMQLLGCPQDFLSSLRSSAWGIEPSWIKIGWN
jgi:large subunit ribosomal protein L6